MQPYFIIIIIVENRCCTRFPKPLRLKVENLRTPSDPEIIQKIAGPHVYTDGRKIEGKVGAVLTWLEGKEVTNVTFSLDPSCTVSQSELFALHRAILLVKSRTELKASMLSDSKSSHLESLNTLTFGSVLNC
ncbi:hypothetical protein EVAR_23780_1 [Eumeta japonica]|uniref:RNase H type-1 domain-containing protein n=1 Tax=Eumeta variegata TaxID=151549 RepID=A0A4C1VGI0_EUMVA|nr:hypothetical protein EVAR_23780_1 [Eumeta japonica]